MVLGSLSLWWCTHALVLCAPQHRRETATASAAGAHRKLGCFSRSAHRRHRRQVVEFTQLTALHNVVVYSPAIPDPGAHASAGWRAQNSTTAGRALAV